MFVDCANLIEPHQCSYVDENTACACTSTAGRIWQSASMPSLAVTASRYGHCLVTMHVQTLQDKYDHAYRDGSSFSKKGAAKATMIGDKNCNTTESDSGSS